eukprot:3614474-Pleurochrysis_carterae.AAC.1
MAALASARKRRMKALEPMGVPTNTMQSQRPSRWWCGDPGRCEGTPERSPWGCLQGAGTAVPRCSLRAADQDQGRRALTKVAYDEVFRRAETTLLKRSMQHDSAGAVYPNIAFLITTYITMLVILYCNKVASPSLV